MAGKVTRRADTVVVVVEVNVRKRPIKKTN